VGQFLRSFHVYRKPARVALERLVCDVYITLGVAASIIEFSDQQRRRESAKPRAGQSIAFVYSPPGDWTSFYPDAEFSDPQIAHLAEEGKLTGIYLFVYDSDNWGFSLFDGGRTCFEWNRDPDEPLSVGKEEVSELRKLLARLFNKPVPDQKLRRLLATDAPLSEEKLFSLSDELGIEGGGIGREDILDGTQTDLDYSLVTALTLASGPVEKSEKKPRAGARAQSKKKAVPCDLLFFAKWPEKPKGKFRLGFYVMDAIVLIRDLMAGAQWVGRTIAEFSSDIGPKLEAVSRRLKLGREKKLIRKTETTDYEDSRWEKIIEAEPFTDSDLLTISRQMDKGNVTLFFADLDEGGSFLRYNVEDGKATLLAVISDLVSSDGEIDDEDAYERIVTYEFESIIHSMFVKTKSEFGCVTILKEDDWDDDTIVERLSEWPPEAGLLTYFGPDSPGASDRNKATFDRLSAEGYQISSPKTGGLMIRTQFEPTDIGKPEFQSARARLSEAFRDLSS